MMGLFAGAGVFFVREKFLLILGKNY